MYYLWEFTLKDGSTITAKFKDSEIEEMKNKYPEIKWTDDNLAFMGHNGGTYV